ncbi:MAG: hypothetical protein ACTSRZ_06500 [Promethearchaeota archaeon]
MPVFRGELVKNEDGVLCLKMQITPANPTKYEIPLEELFEDLLEKQVRIEIMPLKSNWEDDLK